MLYQYYCDGCGATIDKEFKMGRASQFIPCEVCECAAERDYNFSVNIPKPTSDARKRRGKG